MKTLIKTQPLVDAMTPFIVSAMLLLLCGCNEYVYDGQPKLADINPAHYCGHYVRIRFLTTTRSYEGNLNCKLNGEGEITYQLVGEKVINNLSNFEIEK